MQKCLNRRGQLVGTFQGEGMAGVVEQTDFDIRQQCQQGLRSYCTPQIGFREGRQGDSYAGVCPAHLEADFLAGYSDGRLVNAAQQAYQVAWNDQSNYRQQAANIESQIRTEETNLGAADLTDEQRRIIRDRIRRLRDDRGRALDLARDAEWRMRDAEQEVNRLRARFAAYYGSW